jgi:hypothetical protein
MSVDPYRSPAQPERRDTGWDDLVWVARIVWVGSIVRTIVGVTYGERLGGELCLAAMLVIVLPRWCNRRAAEPPS